ncbi:MAG: TetR-like C-terminal domain-containing protein [Pseudomonadota bacterium]
MTKQKAYHHGDLKASLLAVGRRQLEAGGVTFVSLRAAAKEIGVTHAAPARHFSSAVEFHTHLAINGYAELALALRSAAASKDPAATPLNCLCKAYIEFAVRNPNLYRLMCSGDLVDYDSCEIKAESEACLTAILTCTVPDHLDVNERDVAKAEAVRSFLHGHALLRIDNLFLAPSSNDTQDYLLSCLDALSVLQTESQEVSASLSDSADYAEV